MSGANLIFLVAATLAMFASGCMPQMHATQPFGDANTMLVESHASTGMLSSAKAIIIVYRRTDAAVDGTSQPKPPKMIVVPYDELRDVRFMDTGLSFGSYVVGDVNCRTSVLVYRNGYEPVWLEKKFFGRDYRYPPSITLMRCDPVRGRRMVFEAVGAAFRGEAEKYRQQVLKKLAKELD
jgi:hypothetical protein